jgi:hypothetical protein
MTRLIITGRNGAMPRDVAQSMAHLLPEHGGHGFTKIAFRPGPALEAALSRYMRENQIFNQAAAIRALLTKALAS